MSGLDEQIKQEKFHIVLSKVQKWLDSNNAKCPTCGITRLRAMKVRNWLSDDDTYEILVRCVRQNHPCRVWVNRDGSMSH